MFRGFAKHAFRLSAAVAIAAPLTQPLLLSQPDVSFTQEPSTFDEWKKDKIGNYENRSPALI
jgi:hypothetical protein